MRVKTAEMLSSYENMAQDNKPVSDGREWDFNEADNNHENVNDQQETNKNKRKDERKWTISIHKLLESADSMDNILMIVGTVAAVANGAVQPLTVLLFGNLIDVFGRTQNISNVVHEVSQVWL